LNWRGGVGAAAGMTLLVASGSQLASASGGFGGGSADCQATTGLNVMQYGQPQGGGISADGSLTLYCPGTGVDSGNGNYTRGFDSDGIGTIENGTACSVDIDWEPVHWLGPIRVTIPQEGAAWALPVQFWTGSYGATFSGDSVVNATDSAPGPGSSPTAWGPPPATDQLGDGLGEGLVYYIPGGETADAAVTTLAPGKWIGAPSAPLCQGPKLSVVLTYVPDDLHGGGANIPPPPPGWNDPTEQEVLAMAGATPGQIETDASADYVTFAPNCFWINPDPAGPADLAPDIVSVMGTPDSNGASVIYSYYLQAAPSSVIHWDFGDGVQQDVDVGTSGSCVSHVYKQISGIGSVPATGPTIAAAQDVVVTGFVYWYGGDGSTNFVCVNPGRGLGQTYTSQAVAEAGCQTVYPDAITDGSLAPKPIYQIRPIPVT
jgi:hypothetical protein